jgi:predicted nucleic acid-binding protein
LTRPRIVVSDANLLLSGTLRDFLLDAALTRMIEVHWSPHILIEFRRHAPSRFDGMNDADAMNTIEALNRYFPRALVTPSEALAAHIISLGGWGNDLSDAHVAAAAVTARADAIVTENLRHFPRYAMQQIEVAVIPAGDLLAALLEENSEPFIRTFNNKARNLAARYDEGPDGTLATLVRDGQHTFARALGEATGVAVPSRQRAQEMKERRNARRNTGIVAGEVARGNEGGDPRGGPQ